MRLSNLIATLTLALLTSLGLSAQSVRVVFASGQASIQRPDEPALRAIVKGETVVIGTRIVTGADGRVVLTPMPGVKSIITPNTTILLESVSESKTSATEVTHHAVLDLKEGAVVSDLNKPAGVAYDYSIRTARGLAGARGTTFTVGMNAAGIQTVVVEHGTIWLNFTDGRQVVLGIGHLAITGADGTTKNVTNVNDLSPADKAIAQKWVETTINAIATAIESGESVDAEALKKALATAESLGITLPTELKALVDRVLATLEPAAKPEDPKDAKDAVTEQNSQNNGFDSIAAYIATLTEEQASAFYSLRNGPARFRVFLTDGPPIHEEGGYTDAQLLELLRNGILAASLTDILNLYVELKSDWDVSDNQITTFLSDLGILGNGNFTAVGTDTLGLRNLLESYFYGYYYNDQIPEALNESDFPKGNNSTVYGYDFFFPGEGFNNGGKGVTIYDVTFDTDGDSFLRIGATRNLLLDNVALNSGNGKSSGSVWLQAADLVSLNNVRFGSYVSDIMIAAATINLANTTFPDGSHVDLVSKLGEANFGSSKVGYVNFIQNVNYGETPVTATTLPGLSEQNKINIYQFKRPR